MATKTIAVKTTRTTYKKFVQRQNGIVVIGRVQTRIAERLPLPIIRSLVATNKKPFTLFTHEGGHLYATLAEQVDEISNHSRVTCAVVEA